MILNKLGVLTLLTVFIILGDCRRNIVNDENLPISNKKIYVLEKDEIFGGFPTVDNYHMTIIYNLEDTPLTLQVESPFPEKLNIPSKRSPSFGRNAIIPTDYAYFFKVPSLYHYATMNEPSSNTKSSHVWENIVMPPDSGVLVPYSNYYGLGKDLFVKKLGVCQFLNLKVTNDYAIKKASTGDKQFQVTIHEIVENTSQDTIFNVVLSLHIPRKLYFKSQEEVELYYLQSYNLNSTFKNTTYKKNIGRGDGFGHGTINSQGVHATQDTLLPLSKIDFLYEMLIESLEEKYEIYPIYVAAYEMRGKRIWPASKIIINNELFNGHVDYLHKSSLAIPTFLLIAINKDSCWIKDPDDIVPTFYDPYN